jgi:GNAT superfamily N-acetyltransferase
MPAAAATGPAIRPIREDERTELTRLVRANWGSSTVASRGAVHDVADLPCLLALEDERWLGVAAYRVEGDECELVLLEAFEKVRGVGTALLAAMAEVARRSSCRRLWLITTNDNLDALRFYQRRGMRLVRIWPDATTAARQTLKPEIPLVGDYGIALRDELEFELILTDSADAEGPEPGR